MATAPQGSVIEVLAAFVRLGLTSFGGPVAHLGYFREEFVVRRRWLDDRTYADLVALCQFLPGPASSQAGIALGVLRAGLPGGFAAWIGFTFPSALIMIAAAYGVASLCADAAALHGLKVVAVAVVAQAVWGMARTLCPDRERATIAILAAVALLVWRHALAQIVIIVAGGMIGWRLLRDGAPAAAPSSLAGVDRRLAIGCWIAFFGLLIALPLARAAFPFHAIQIFDSFYRAGALVFGGGHVVLPLLHAGVVSPGWVSDAQFIAGYGLAQAVPGPLFTFAAYLGAVQTSPPNGWAGGMLALLAIFLPAWLLVIGALPFWDWLHAREEAQAALRGINAAVVGLLLATLYTPVVTSAIMTPFDAALALGCFALLALWKWPPWLVVVVAGGIGWAMNV
ncbi:MAG: chromate efflux transporter [Roseiflexus sp.]|nr:chromate efflux transporter [Roseiflexus sp.]MDW8148681.1 chromate efflux transporter [Roseiflexaceae bacterium]